MRLAYLVLLPLIAVPASLPVAAPDTAPPATATVTGTIKATRGGKPASSAGSWVYLSSTTSPRPKPAQAAIVQKGFEFCPRTLMIPKGSTVAFPNADDEPHNVFSPSDFDLGRYERTSKKPAPSRKFATEGEFDIFCDIHANMEAAVSVVNSEHIAKVVNDRFTITNVPPGTYKVVVWNPYRTRASDKDEAVVKDGPYTITAGVFAVPHEIKLPLGASTKPHKRYGNEPYDPKLQQYKSTPSSSKCPP